MKEKLINKISIVALLVVVIGGTFAGGYFIGKKNQLIVPPAGISGTENNAVNKAGDFGPFWKTWQLLDEKFVSASTSTKPTDQERVWGAIEGMVATMGDPYTIFMPPSEKKAFDENISGNFEGVGMEVGMKDGILTVIAPLKDTPAARAGILAGDRILAIDGTSTQDMKVDQAVKLMRGKKGTTVNLVVYRENKSERKELSIVRDVINIPTIDTERKGDVFIIRLYNFSATSASQFRNAIREFVDSKSNKLVLDLRGNPGGYLEASVDMASWFLPSGKVIVKENFGQGKAEEVIRSKGYNIFSDGLKMVVLVDNGSASASEILAGALQEHGIAKLVGTKTFGKGSVQELVEVTPDTSLKVTIAQWLTPNGKSISQHGLTPDTEVKRTEEDMKANKDPQLDKAIEILNQ